MNGDNEPQLETSASIRKNLKIPKKPSERLVKMTQVHNMSQSHVGATRAPARHEILKSYTNYFIDAAMERHFRRLLQETSAISSRVFMMGVLLTCTVGFITDAHYHHNDTTVRRSKGPLAVGILGVIFAFLIGNFIQFAYVKRALKA